MERFPFPICASSMRPPKPNYVTWTWNSRRATTGRERWRKKHPRASRSTGVRKTHRVCVAFSTNAKSPHESSRYEHRSRPSRCSPSPRLHRGRSPLSLYCGDAFRLFCGTPISCLHRCSLGQAHNYLLEQTSRQETRSDRMLSKERNGLSPVLAPPLPPDRPREHPQSPATRNRIHPAPHRNARFCPPEPGVSVPRNRARKSPLLLRYSEHPEALSSRQTLPRQQDPHNVRPVFRG